jgi:glycosyltransferase involved in cell wall biosynthesis
MLPGAHYVTISDFQRERMRMPRIRTIHHGTDPSRYRSNLKKQPYLSFLGRIAPPKGVHHAIEIAKKAGIPLKIAGEIQPLYQDYWERVVKPQVDGKFIEFIGEVGLEGKNELLGNSMAMLFPIDWDEPFGLVLIEAMACGTPVLAMPRGSVPEIVREGVSGHIRQTPAELAECAKNLSIDPAGVRRYMENFFSAERMVRDYLDLYSQIFQERVEKFKEPEVA